LTGPGAAISEPSRTPKGDTDNHGRSRHKAQNHSSEPAEDALYRFASRNSQVAREAWTEEDFRSQIARYGSDVFGREEDIAFLDRAWANQQVNVVTLF
jgi:hypothetical protein